MVRFEGWIVTAVTIVCVLASLSGAMCVWPFSTPEVGGLRSPCQFVLRPVDGRSEFAAAAAGFLATVLRATSPVRP